MTRARAGFVIQRPQAQMLAPPARKPSTLAMDKLAPYLQISGGSPSQMGTTSHASLPGILSPPSPYPRGQHHDLPQWQPSPTPMSMEVDGHGQPWSPGAKGPPMLGRLPSAGRNQGLAPAKSSSWSIPNELDFNLLGSPHRQRSPPWPWEM